MNMISGTVDTINNLPSNASAGTAFEIRDGRDVFVSDGAGNWTNVGPLLAAPGRRKSNLVTEGVYAISQIDLDYGRTIWVGSGANAVTIRIPADLQLNPFEDVAINLLCVGHAMPITIEIDGAYNDKTGGATLNATDETLELRFSRGRGEIAIRAAKGSY